MIVFAIAWYTWVPWVVIGVLIVIVLAIWLLRKGKGTSVAETKLKLAEQDEKTRENKAKLVEESLAQRKQRKEKAANELAELTLKHENQLKKLTAKQKKDFEDAKADPESGIDFIHDYLDLDDSS